MPTLFLVASLLALTPPFRTGDVVLQTSKSPMSLPIQQATRSPWSHTGLIEVTDEGVFVLEAVQPVSRTPYAQWRKRGQGGVVKVLRLKDLDPKAAAKAVAWAKARLGTPYDVRFGWGDDALYCSELVVKAIEAGAGVRVGHFDRLDALDLSPASKKRADLLGVPLSTEVVSPAALDRDAKFEVVRWTDTPAPSRPAPRGASPARPRSR